MAKTSKKKRSADQSSPFVLVRSTTGRPFTRAGIRFEPDRDEPVNLDKLDPEKRERLLKTPQLAVQFVDETEWELAVSEQRHAEDEAMSDVNVSSLLTENAMLRQQVEALSAEIALLTGRRSGGDGPRENDDKKTSSKPLIG